LTLPPSDLPGTAEGPQSRRVTVRGTGSGLGGARVRHAKAASPVVPSVGTDVRSESSSDDDDDRAEKGEDEPGLDKTLPLRKFGVV